jgi:putative polyhydroxyalkanoate system protein
MAKFNISKPYTMPREEVREAAKALADTLHRKHGVRPQWQGDSLRIKGAGVEGSLNFEGDTIDISVKLGLLASAFGPALQREVQKYLDEFIT